MTLSVAIVLGVAPLLFVQVIYDPFWYTANVISAFWAFAFLLVVILAFYSAYGFYLGNRKRPHIDPVFGWAALAFMLAAALLMHMLSMEVLSPESWRAWISGGPEGLNMRGTQFHGVSFGRLLHFLLASLAVTGVFLMLYSWYFEPRPDYEPEYLEYVERLGARLALWASLLQAGAGFWWAGGLPAGAGFLEGPFFPLVVAAGIAFIAYLGLAVSRPRENALGIALTGFAVIFLMCYAREALRMDCLAPWGYSAYDYKVNLSWGSTLLFFLTFLGGLAVLAFPLKAAFAAGRTPPGEVAVIPAGLGRAALGLLLLWLGAVVLLGLAISIRNGVF